jgi:hypothetical protein
MLSGFFARSTPASDPAKPKFGIAPSPTAPPTAADVFKNFRRLIDTECVSGNK